MDDLLAYAGVHKKKNHKTLTTKTRQKKYIVKKIKDLKLPEKGESVRFVMSGGFNVISVCEAILQNYPADIVLSYYVISQDALSFFESALSKGRIRSLFIQTSTLRLSAKDMHVISQIKNMAKKYNVAANFCVTHCKIMCIKSGDNFYVIEGSGNLSGNARVEQYCVSNDKSIHDFYADWIVNAHETVKGTKELKDV